MDQKAWYPGPKGWMEYPAEGEGVRHMKLYDLKGGVLTDAERLELARLLVKAGYTVSIGKDKEGGTRPRKYIEIGGAENERSVG